jgi:hypothetical protein
MPRNGFFLASTTSVGVAIAPDFLTTLKKFLILVFDLRRLNVMHFPCLFFVEEIKE